jgi:hypothetical protein
LAAAFMDDGVRHADGNEAGRYALPYADYHGFLSQRARLVGAAAR